MKKLLTIFLIMITFCIQAQDSDWVLYNFPVLPSNTTHCVGIDLANQVWVGTTNGVAVKIGETWKKYSYAQGLPSPNRVHGMAFGTDGLVWLACGGGMATTSDSMFTSYNYLNAPLDNIKFLSVALAPNGTMYCGTEGAGIYSFDGTNWVSYSTDNTFLPNDTINALTFDDAGKLWISTQNGLTVMDGTDWINFNSNNSGLPNNQIMHVTQGPEGSSYISTYGGGLAKYDGIQWVVYNSANTGQPLFDYTTDVAFDANGILWMGGYIGGLYSYDGTTWSEFLPNNSPLPDITVRAIAIDNIGTKWMATPSGLSGYSGGPQGIFDVLAPVRTVFFGPNPASKILTLSPGFSHGQLIIYSMAGKPVMNRKIQDDRNVNISMLPAGSYLVKFESENHQYYSNLLIKE